MASVGYSVSFASKGSAYYAPPSAGTAGSVPATTPMLPAPQAWLPAATLTQDSIGAPLRLSFTEPPGWSREPWHIPASPAGFYVPVHLSPSSRAWIGGGPALWGYSIDGSFRQTGVAPNGAGARTEIDFLPSDISPSSGQPYDWATPHTFRLHLLYQDVPEYQWWQWDGLYGLAPAGTDILHYYFFPQDKFRANSFYDGYPANEPVQPVLPLGYSALDYGGLGPVQVPGEHLGPGGHFSNVLNFTNHREPGVWLEVISDPFTLSLPPRVPGPAGFSSVRIVGSPVVGQTLTAVLS